jgi:hypothetical protein
VTGGGCLQWWLQAAGVHGTGFREGPRHSDGLWTVKGKDQCEAQLTQRVAQQSRGTRAAESRADPWKTEVRWGIQLLPSALAGVRMVVCTAQRSPSRLRRRVGGRLKWKTKWVTVIGRHGRDGLGMLRSEGSHTVCAGTGKLKHDTGRCDSAQFAS